MTTEAGVEFAKTDSPHCARCGQAFECRRDLTCWCAAENYRLPMPAGDSGCLCPDCLQKAATAQKTA
jgi:hypothetical protein